MENSLGTKVKKIREQYKYTQEYVADSIQVSRKWYGMFENGEVELKAEKIDAIAQVFNLKITDLLSFEEKNIFHNTLNDNSKIDGLTQGTIIGKQEQQIQQQKELYEKMLFEKEERNIQQKEIYEKLLTEKDEHIKWLNNQLKSKK